VRSRVEDIARILLDWHVILIAGSLLLVFPLVFYLSSLDKTPVRVKKVELPEKRTIAKPKKRRAAPAKSAEPAEEQPRFPERRRHLPEEHKPPFESGRRTHAEGPAHPDQPEERHKPSE
jgi:hypothetical protein